MNILFLENENSWQAGCLLKLNSGGKNKVEVLTDLQLSEPINDLARYIHEEYPFIDLFLININLISGTENRSACAGIKLFKFLRLYHLNQHCILYSFLNREQLMQLSPDHLILFSEGLSFIRLPFDLSSLDFDNLAKKIAPDDLSRYLKAESYLPDDRHFFANWWGVLQLWKAHRYLHKLDKQTSKPIEKKMFLSANQKESYQGKLAEYLFGEQIEQLSPAYIENQRELHTNFGNFNLSPEDYDKQYVKLETKIEDDEKEINRLNIALEEIQPLTWWQRLFTRLAGIINKIRRKINHLENERIESLNEQELIKKYKELINFKELDKKRSEIEIENLFAKNVHNIEIKKKNLNGRDIFNIQWFIQKLKEKSPKILYIDDQADEGWAIVFQYVIYGREVSENFTVINPEKTNIEDLICRCFDNVNIKNPDLIILDLRLYGEKDVITDYDNLSGIKVLKALKNGDKTQKPVTCPIMVVTASNKAIAHDTAKAYRADASWIKEGLDNHFSSEETVDNYLDFLNKVFLLCCQPEFKFLKTMKEGINKVKGQKSFWWEVEDRFAQLYTPGAKLNHIKKDDVFEILEDSLQLAETFLQKKLTKSLSPAFENYLPSLITIKLFQILELIHEENVDLDEHIAIKTRIDTHLKTSNYNKLLNNLKIRNNAVHQLNLNLENIENYINSLCDYLLNKPQIQRPLNIVGQIDVSNISSQNTKYKAKIKNIEKNYFLIDKETISPKFKEGLRSDFICYEMDFITNNNLEVGNIVQFELRPTVKGYLAFKLKNLI